MAEMRRSVKDSVFTYLFKQPEYTRQLYLALHPEDTSVQESDFKLVTLEKVRNVLKYNTNPVEIEEPLRLAALRPLERMLRLAAQGRES